MLVRIYSRVTINQGREKSRVRYYGRAIRYYSWPWSIDLRVHI
jgi:hypothetical protein